MFKKELRKYFFVMYLKVFASWIMCMIGGLPLIGLSFAAMYYVHIILGLAVGALGGAVCSLFNIYFGNYYIDDIFDNRDIDDINNKFWEKLRSEKFKITPKQITKYTLSIPITGGIILLALIIFLSIPKNTTVIIMILYSIIIISAFYWFTTWILIKRHYAKFTCKNCNTVHCFEIVHMDYKSGEYVSKTKTVNTTGKVGELYLGSEKIADVHGNTGTTDLRKITQFSTTIYECKCIFCENEKTFRTSKSNTSHWG